MDQNIRQKQSLGARIRQARKAHGVSQADLALAIGVSQPAIASWESGIHDPRREVLGRVADALEVPFDWLAAGAVSTVRADKDPAAAYLRRPMRNVPVLSRQAMAQFAQDPEIDPFVLAEDYIPVPTHAQGLIAMITQDGDEGDEFPAGTILMFNHMDKHPLIGAYYLGFHGGEIFVAKHPSPRCAPQGKKSAAEPPAVIGCLRMSIRIY